MEWKGKGVVRKRARKSKGKGKVKGERRGGK